MNSEVQTSLPDEKPKSKNDRSSLMLGFPRKKLLPSSDALTKYSRAILEASAELTHDFHTTYMDKIVKGNLGEKILDVQHPSTSYETLKKGFLHYLNGSGKYLIIREHLREAVFALLHQKSLTSHVNGFKSRQQYQEFLHDSYSFMLDAMNEALYSTTFRESLETGITKCATICNNKHNDSRKARHLHDLLTFAQEALAERDYENAHRLHIERVAQSGDSDVCWTDFAIMWLSRGDDRLAQIAVREALTKNSTNLVGLLLAGLIAGNHRDELGISHLENLLEHRPLCPEIHVILGTVHNLMGNIKLAESHYEVARKIHHSLTVPAKPVLETNVLRDDEKSSEVKKSTKKEKNREKNKKSNRKSGSGGKSPTDIKRGASSKDAEGESKSSKTTSKDAKKSSRESKRDFKKIPTGDDSDALKSAGTDTHNAATESSDFRWKITKKDIGATKPPSLGSCLEVIWNVTKKPMQKLFMSDPEYSIGNEYNPLQVSETFDDIEGETPLQSRVTSAEAENEEWKEIVQQKPRHHFHSHHHRRHRHHKKLVDIDDSIFKANPDANLCKLNVQTGTANEEQPGEEASLPQETTLPTNTIQNHPQFTTVDNAENINKSETQIHSQRFGSEFLWTAHLLLKLRQFEFLDLIMAQEISRTSTRSVEYLYIRAVSLHLRGRDQEALEVIEEGLSFAPQNGILFTLQGHAYYNLKDKDAAMRSYEQALTLPHGRESLHLVYLRFGTLCRENGDLELAKRILLKGVVVSPSPYLWIALGNVSYDLGDLEDALEALAEANKLDNTNPEVWAYLSKVCLAQGNQTLAEQTYKWAIRFGLKKGKLMDDIKDLQHKLGYGDPAFPQIPTCIPHEVFLQRLGRDTPLELYAEALNFSHLQQQRNKFENRESEETLIRKLQEKDSERLAAILNAEEEAGEEDEKEERQPVSLLKKAHHVISRVKNSSLPTWKVKKRSVTTGKKSRVSKSSITTITKEKKRTKKSLGRRT